jgi:hypothetical protein
MDHRYAGQGLAMIRSLRANGGEQTVWVLCLNDAAVDVVNGFNAGDVRAVTMAEMAAHFPGLVDARGDRSLIEYYFTLTPHIIRYVFDREPAAQRVAYLDSDLFFFGAVSEMWRASGDAPVAIIPHNFNPKAQHLERYGTYNVGWVGFKRSEQGMTCLDFWATSCRDWCRDQPEAGRFADQGYLDRFVEFAPDLAVVDHKGCNLGPWNVGRYLIAMEGGNVTIDRQQLIFFHFTGFKKDMGGRWYNSHRLYRAGTTKVVRDFIYRPYLAELLSAKLYVEPLQAIACSSAVPLKRKRGGAVPVKRRIYPLVQKAGQILDLLTGKAIKEPTA